jgi:hypothetical protein
LARPSSLTSPRLDLNANDVLVVNTEKVTGRHGAEWPVNVIALLHQICSYDQFCYCPEVAGLQCPFPEFYFCSSRKSKRVGCTREGLFLQDDLAKFDSRLFLCHFVFAADDSRAATPGPITVVYAPVPQPSLWEFLSMQLQPTTLVLQVSPNCWTSFPLPPPPFLLPLISLAPNPRIGKLRRASRGSPW